MNEWVWVGLIGLSFLALVAGAVVAIVALDKRQGTTTSTAEGSRGDMASIESGPAYTRPTARVFASKLSLSLADSVVNSIVVSRWSTVPNADSWRG